ncbi:phosducin protein 3 [Echinococcus multilocularis]|uniref:Phosducin protein 3 n=1 Tax=Echinococcus multilocularis TaxID=6211 RepID=A0A087VYI9_ECHMU|nr:phosducin protein 3 [Echinococcus multilocularis]
MSMGTHQDTAEDTEFNAILREKGILPSLPKPTEATPPPSPGRDLVQEMSYSQLTEELEALEDRGGVNLEEDMKFLELYRRKRLEEMREAIRKAKFGSYGEVTKCDWTRSVSNAGEGVNVVVHLAQKGNKACTVVDQHLQTLAARYPTVKFLRGEASLCVPNFPDSNLPTIIVYCEGNVKAQYVGSRALGGYPCSIGDLEQRLAKVGAISLAEMDETDDNTRVERSNGVTRIRASGTGRYRQASDSYSD